MRTALFLLLMCLGFPLQAQETSSLRIDLSLYRTTACSGEGPPSFTSPSLAGAPYRDPTCTLAWQPTRNQRNNWEAYATTWVVVSDTKKFGIGLDFAMADQGATLKLRGRRILVE